MNEMNQKIYDLAMESVVPGKEAEAEELLREGFDRFDAGTFDQEYLTEVHPRYKELVQPDRWESFKGAMRHLVQAINLDYDWA